MKIGIICSRVRPEEKLLFNEIRKQGHELVKIDDRKLMFDLTKKPDFNADIIIIRSISHSRFLYISKILNNRGIKTINSYDVGKVCGDKLLTSLILEKNNIKTPRVRVAFNQRSALKAIEELRYPVVIKPNVGSWGRLMAKVENRNQAESILEHKKTLGDYYHSIFYIQEYIDKPGRDIRAFVVGRKVIAAIYRKSEHWITNTARGGSASNCPVTDEIKDICLKSADAVGGGVLALDLFETKDNGLMVNEINHTMEFRNSIKTTGVNIPGRIVEYLENTANKKS
ncbi:lysine biosynthesis protein LysX [Candidatus Woesearchaeota archaeon]|nr:lysine biosynthesis protein LysX [Candidatus Woesearchaeota archaeon]